jgi:hypothetical protein
MKALILGALLALTPIPALAQHVTPLDVTFPTKENLAQVGAVCMGVATKEITVQEILDTLKLDTLEEQQEFVNTCSIYFQGLSDGLELASTPEVQSKLQKLPEAAVK